MRLHRRGRAADASVRRCPRARASLTGTVRQQGARSRRRHSASSRRSSGGAPTRSAPTAARTAESKHRLRSAANPGRSDPAHEGRLQRDPCKLDVAGEGASRDLGDQRAPRRPGDRRLRRRRRSSATRRRSNRGPSSSSSAITDSRSIAKERRAKGARHRRKCSCPRSRCSSATSSPSVAIHERQGVDRVKASQRAPPARFIDTGSRAVAADRRPVPGSRSAARDHGART